MKRVSNLYNKIISIDNLYLAEKKARLGKSKKIEIIKFVEKLNENILDLHKELVNKTYCTSKYSHFIIYEPKERFISKLPYKDRIVHHAILNPLNKIFVDSFISQTYSCIKKRGIHKCLKVLKRYLKDKNNTKYCLKLDIFKFYPSVNNEILKSLLRKKFKDKDLLWLLDGIINSHKSLPLGNYTSQWFGNFYLNNLLHWLKQDKRIKYLLVYCDDIVILHSNKEYLHTLRKEIQKYLLFNLKLELSNFQVFPINSRGINFLGYVSYHNKIRLRKSIKQSMKKNLNERNKASYYGWTKHGNCRNLENKYLK